MNFHSLNVNSASSPLFCFCIFLDRQNQWDVALCLVTRSGACQIYVNIFFLLLITKTEYALHSKAR